MLRGFRWQLILLFVAIILLGAAILFQPAPPSETEPSPAPTLTPAPTEQVLAPTPLPPAQIESPVIFREGIVGQVQRINPLFAGLNPVDCDITRLIFEGLVGTNQYGEYIPVLAENWTIASTRLEYVFQLRQDVLWQDGLPFTAADVTTTIHLLQAPGDALPADLTAFWRTVEVELLDEYTVRFRLAQPLASFLDHLRIGILPAHVFSGLSAEQLVTHPFNLSPIGTGPYQLEQLVGSAAGVSAVHLRVAPVYRQRPEGQNGYELERLIFQLYESETAALEALRSGDIDAFSGVEDQSITDMEQANAIHTHISLSPTVGTLIFNWESTHTPAFGDQRARQALLIGMDRAGLVNRHMGGEAVVADSPLLPGSWAYSGPISWPGYDPAAAGELLAQVDFAMPEPEATPEAETADEAAASAEGTAVPTSTPAPPAYDFMILSSDNPAHVALVADLAAQWTQIGLTIVTEAVPETELLTRLDTGEFDIALVELSLSPNIDPDPYVFWHQGQYPDGQNYGGINDRRSSELLELARRDPNGVHRTAYYAEFQRVFANRTLSVPLYYPVYEYAITPALEGVQLGYMGCPSDRFSSIGSWSFIG